MAGEGDPEWLGYMSIYRKRCNLHYVSEWLSKQSASLKDCRETGKSMPHPTHEFWPETISLLTDGVIRWQHLLGTQQIKDAYLLGVGVANRGRFVSFDQRIRIGVVSGATPAKIFLI